MNCRSSLVFRWSLVVLCLACLPSICLAEKLRGSVVDAQSGQPLPCRLYVQTENGKWLFPKSLGDQEALTYDVERGPRSIEKFVTLPAAPFEIEVPRGKVTLAVELGKEYQALTQAVNVSTEAVEVKLPLSRWIDMPQRGWYSGDTHLHRKLEDVPNLMLAEDLHVTFPLTYWVREAYQPAIEGKAGGNVKPELITVAPHRCIWPVNTEYELFTLRGKPHTQGAVFVLNQQRGMELGTPPVTPVAKLAHETGAILDLDKHTWNWTPMIVPVMKVDLFELANNHIWRTEFAFKNWTLDVLPKTWDIETEPGGYTEAGWIDWGFKTYYAFLNCGFRMRPTGGTGNGVHSVPAGFGRVYVNVQGEFSYDKWVKGLNDGHSFVTTGPMLIVKFNDQDAGTVFQKTGEAIVTGTAESAAPLDRIEIILNGDIVRTVKPVNKPTNTGGFTSEISETIPLKNSAWLAVRCFDAAPGKRFRYAHTAPAHYEIDGPVRPKRREVAYFIERVTQEIARNKGVLSAEELAEYEQALAIYKKLEAIAR